MVINNLFKRAGALGFPLFEVAEEQNANLTMADMVKSHDLRLWEGFPVVLANSMEKGLFDYNTVGKYFKKSSDKLYFNALMVLSLALYKELNLKFTVMSETRELLMKKEGLFKKYLEELKKNSDMKVGNYVVSGRKLKSTFNNYFNKNNVNLNELLSAKEELGLEYSLSQVFSPKQKELFLKKLEGEKLNKTEKEYYSRVVKKKASALANPELHRLSQKLLK